VRLEMATDRESAGPRERPVGQGRLHVVRLDLDGTPERQDLVGQVETDALEPGDRLEVGMAKDEPTG
jgi:hypothetical protein